MVNHPQTLPVLSTDKKVVAFFSFSTDRQISRVGSYEVFGVPYYKRLGLALGLGLGLTQLG